MMSDLLILAALTKFFWDLAKDQLVSERVFIFGIAVLAFLLGLSNERGEWRVLLSGRRVLKEGLSLVGLILFWGILRIQGASIVYVALFLSTVLIYLFGRLARLTARVIVAGTVLFLALYLFYMFLGR